MNCGEMSVIRKRSYVAYILFPKHKTKNQLQEEKLSKIKNSMEAKLGRKVESYRIPTLKSPSFEYP